MSFSTHVEEFERNGLPLWMATQASEENIKAMHDDFERAFTRDVEELKPVLQSRSQQEQFEAAVLIMCGYAKIHNDREKALEQYRNFIQNKNK